MRTIRQTLMPRDPPVHAEYSMEKPPGFYAYRLCCIGEHPWNLRKGEAVSSFQFTELRALLLNKLRDEKNPYGTSCFLHANLSLWKVLAAFKERTPLYSNFLVRFPRVLEDVEMIDFEDVAERQKWFGERQDDSYLLKELSRACRADKKTLTELVYYDRPKLSLTEWWDAQNLRWRFCDDDSAESQHWARKLMSDDRKLQVRLERLGSRAKDASSWYSNAFSRHLNTIQNAFHKFYTDVLVLFDKALPFASAAHHRFARPWVALLRRLGESPKGGSKGIASFCIFLKIKAF